MEENGATYLCDLVKPAGQSAGGGAGGSQQLPMYLVVLGGGIPGAMIRLSPGGTRLGRAADNTVQLPDPSISRYHAFLGADEEGIVRLNDMGSTNGTFLNGRRLPENTRSGSPTATASSSGPRSSSSSSAPTRARSNSSARCSSGPSATP